MNYQYCYQKLFKLHTKIIKYYNHYKTIELHQNSLLSLINKLTNHKKLIKYHKYVDKNNQNLLENHYQYDIIQLFILYLGKIINFISEKRNNKNDSI